MTNKLRAEDFLEISDKIKEIQRIDLEIQKTLVHWSDSEYEFRMIGKRVTNAIPCVSEISTNYYAGRIGRKFIHMIITLLRQARKELIDNISDVVDLPETVKFPKSFEDFDAQEFPQNSIQETGHEVPSGDSKEEELGIECVGVVEGQTSTKTSFQRWR